MPNFTLEKIEQELKRRETLSQVSPTGFNLEDINAELIRRGAIPVPSEPERFARTKAFLKQIKPTAEKIVPTIKEIGKTAFRSPYLELLTGGLSRPITHPLETTEWLPFIGKKYEYFMTLPRKRIFGAEDFIPEAEKLPDWLVDGIIPTLIPRLIAKREPFKALREREVKFRKQTVGFLCDIYTRPDILALEFAPVIAKGILTRPMTEAEHQIVQKAIEPVRVRLRTTGLPPEQLFSEGTILNIGDKTGFIGKNLCRILKGERIRIPRGAKIKMPLAERATQVMENALEKIVPSQVIKPTVKPTITKPAAPIAKAKIPEVVSISGLAKIKSHVETQLGRELIEREEKAIDTLKEGDDYVIDDELIVTHKTGTLADFEISDVDAVRQATTDFLAKERKEILQPTGEVTFYQAVRRLGGAASYKKGMPGALREEYNTIVPIHCRKGEPKGGRPLDELASAFSEEYPQFGIENEKDLLEAFKNEKMARMNRVTEVYGRPIADKAKKLIFGKKPSEIVQKTLFGPEEKVPAKVKPTKVTPGQPELPFGAKPKFEVPVAKPEVIYRSIPKGTENFHQRWDAAKEILNELKENGYKAEFNRGDATITIYHGTSTENAKKILKEGRFEEMSFFSHAKSKAAFGSMGAKGYGKEILSVKVDPRDISFNSGTGEIEAEEGLIRNPITSIWESPQRIKPTPEVKPKIAEPAIEKAPPITAIPPREPIPTKEVSKVKRSEIAKMISEKLDLPIRIGHFRHRAKGIYKVKPKIVRLKAPTDIETACHEVGHHIQNELNPELSKYSGELMALVKDFPTSHRNKKEGFAEFIRLYVTDPDSATKLLPELSKYFDNFISNYPEVEEVLLNARKDYDRWLKLPATARILSHISPTPEKATMPSIQRLYSLAIDELYPLKKYVDIVKKKKIKVFEQDDPFILATAHRGWHGKADAFLRYKTFDTNFNWTGSPLSDIYRPIGEAKALDEFDAFLVARRTLELKRRGIKTGIRPDDARRTLIELRRKYPFFREKAKELYDYQNKLLKYARDSELISPETYFKMRGLNKYYAPFYRVMEIAGRKGLLGKGVVNLPNIFKQIRGSEREIIRPSESIVKNTYTIIDAAERNQIGLALVKLAQRYPKDLGRHVEKLPPTMARIAEVSIKELAKELEREGIEIPDDMAKEVVNIFRPSIFKPARNIITVMQKGKRTFYQVDPDIYDALTSTDRESMNILLKLLSYPARWLRLGAVALSPEFVVRNPVRDAFTAFCYSKGGFIPGLDTLRGLWSVVKHDELYWKWKISGAEHSMLVSLDREYLQKNIRDLIATWSKKLKNVVKHPLENARILAELGEEATRIGEYRLVLGGGKRWFLMAEKTPKDLLLKSKMLKAGISARQVTLDFSRLGAKTRAVNSIIAFWNANVQDLDKIARGFKDKPIRSLFKVLAGITLPSVLLWFANKDDERYKEIPQWQKDIFWIIPTEKTIWRIPKPFTLGLLFGTVPERILERTYNENPEAFKDLWDSISRGINPGVIPTAFLAPLETITNYSFFLDRPVVSSGLKRLLPEMQHSIYTTEISKIIGKGLKVSPSKIDYFVRGYFGALGRYGLETVDQILKGTGIVSPPKGPKSTLADVPLVRGFVVREPVGSASQALNEFYELYEKSLQAEATIKELKKQKNDPLAEKYKIAHPGYRFATGFRGIGAYLSAMRRKRIRIWESKILSPEEKSKQILEVETKMTRKVREFLNKYESRLREQK